VFYSQAPARGFLLYNFGIIPDIKRYKNKAINKTSDSDPLQNKDILEKTGTVYNQRNIFRIGKK